MSGGGSNGAWEAGVLYGLAHSGNPADYHYDVVSGVSSGAINAAALSTIAPEDIVAATEYIVNSWSSLKTSDIYVHMPGGIVIAMFEEHSLYDTTPAIATFGRIFGTGGYKKHLALSAVDANTGEKVTMTDEQIPFNELPTAVLGSASVPIAFPSTRYGGHLLMDGMTAYNTDVEATIERCKQLVGDEGLITIDVLQITAQG